MIKIKAAAILDADGKHHAGTSHRHARHSNGGVSGSAGFLTTENKFVSRREAARIALASGQAETISDPFWGLNSEDLTRGYPL